MYRDKALITTKLISIDLVYIVLPILVQKDEGPSFSLAGPPGLAVFLRDLDSDRRAKTETELLWDYVVPPNP